MTEAERRLCFRLDLARFAASGGGAVNSNVKEIRQEKTRGGKKAEIKKKKNDINPPPPKKR